MHQQNLKENLFDERLMHLLMCESMYHQPDKEKSDPSTKVLHACLYIYYCLSAFITFV